MTTNDVRLPMESPISAETNRKYRADIFWTEWNDVTTTVRLVLWEEPVEDGEFLRFKEFVGLNLPATNWNVRLSELKSYKVRLMVDEA